MIRRLEAITDIQMKAQRMIVVQYRQRTYFIGKIGFFICNYSTTLSVTNKNILFVICER